MTRRAYRRPIGGIAIGILLVLALVPFGGGAASLSRKDVQIIGKIFGFIDPPSTGGTVAVVYAPGNPASQLDAQGIAELFGDGVKAGTGIVRADVVASTALGQGSPYIAAILATGLSAETVSALIRSSRILCITSDVGQVEAGNCVLAVQSEPRVDIVVSRSAAAAAGISFATAFRMLIHEL